MRCAGAAAAALAALALAALAAPPAPCEPDHYDSTAALPACQRLAHKYKHNVKSLGVRCASVRGQPKAVALVWGSAPARAAAALLHAVLRHALRYRRVYLREGPHYIEDLAKEIAMVPMKIDPDLVIGVSTAVEMSPHKTYNNGLTGARLRDVALSSVAAQCRLHAYLAPAARGAASCRHHTRWTFYANVSALTDCAFRKPAFNQTSCKVYSVDCNSTLERLRARAQSTALPLDEHVVDRATLLRHLRADNHSFLFLDFDIWEGEPNVSIVEPPPCVHTNSSCQQELDPTIAMRVADVRELKFYTPHLYRFFQQFTPSRESLRLILKREGYAEMERKVNIEDAACEWAINNTEILKSWNLDMYDQNLYEVAIFFCKGDPDYNYYHDKVIKVIEEEINKNTSVSKYYKKHRTYLFNCSDVNELGINVTRLMSIEYQYKLLGVVAAGAAGAAEATLVASAHHVPLLLVAAAPDDEPHAAAGAPAWRVAGGPRHLAHALQHFVLASGWNRLAVLTQKTQLAEQYYAVLAETKLLDLRQYKIPFKLTELPAAEVLQKLQEANARIVFVNADAQAAVVILSAAIKHQMSYKDGFVWIVRDWIPNNATFNITHFTVSFWRRGKEDVMSDANAGRPNLRKNLSEELGSRPWPPLTAPLADALLTLGEVFNYVFFHHPATRNDLHSDVMIRLLNDRLAAEPITGITHDLNYKERSIEEAFVFVDEWRGDIWQRRLATWRVNASARHDAVRGNYTRPHELPKDDGKAHCYIRGEKGFQPKCYDYECAAALVLILLTPVAVVLVRRRFAYHMQKRQVEIMARRQHVANVLAGYLVKRDALELREELGAGRFGCVRLALLRAPARASRYVAAKALRDNAAPTEESEFLREACTIASLDHEHVVRLVGVCIADGPPLVLMELAFFGDLLGYLRARRHLAEGRDSEALAACEEAAHVSAEALTRLAREAAAALEYLAKRGVVHRDVRAANCLVDARRSLKLADFGMARATVAGADGAPEYACRRRGLFPVLWMAPESLAHGVFSAASDVWALGVLVLELVTLGARPYGCMSPLRVLEYVASGGCPPLPLDVTPQTRGLAQLCWARAAERRPSASEVRVYLSARPRALRPAGLREREEPADADSGFGESPSTELLSPDSPLDSVDRLEVFIATP